jgi:PEP-CTERM motif
MLLMVVASSTASAQTYYPLNQTGSINIGAFAFTLGSCTYQLNNGAATSCGNDDIEVSVTTARNSITLNYVNSVLPGSALLSQATANGCTCIQFELTVSNAAGLSKAVVSATGYGKSGDTLDNWLELSGTNTRLAQADITTNGHQSAVSTWDPTGDPTLLNLELGLGVNAAYQSGVLSLNSGSVTFAAAPEPATITLLLSGIGWLGIARSRRLRSNQAFTPTAVRSPAPYNPRPE